MIKSTKKQQILLQKILLKLESLADKLNEAISKATN
jgi:hypothetical protein